MLGAEVVGGKRNDRCEISFGADGNVLKIKVVMVTQICEYTKTTDLRRVTVCYVSYISHFFLKKKQKPVTIL